MTTHVCNIVIHGGHRIRIVAIRRNRRVLLADYDLLVIQQRAGESPMAQELELLDFPRALGPQGIFETILARMACSDQPAYDEHGVEIPMPERTPAEWAKVAKLYMAMAREACQRAGLFAPEFIEQAEGPGLFGAVETKANA